MEKALILLLFFYLIYLGALGIFMFFSRVKAVRQNRVDPRYFKTYDLEVPRDLKAIENHWTNQFQIPMLFFITAVLALQLKVVTTSFFSLACLFVVSRLTHSFVHLGSNKVLIRAGIFFFGYFLVLGQWLVIIANQFF